MQQDLLSQLRDIRGLDAVSWWPPAPGWWGLTGLLLVICGGIYFYRRYKEKQAARWQVEAKALFGELRSEQDKKKKAVALSELLRRLAIKQHGRDACAGLEGKKWLEWLAKNDPQGFDWKQKAKILIEAPYAPEEKIANNDFEPLIAAAERWVK